MRDVACCTYIRPATLMLRWHLGPRRVPTLRFGASPNTVQLVRVNVVFGWVCG